MVRFSSSTVYYTEWTENYIDHLFDHFFLESFESKYYVVLEQLNFTLESFLSLYIFNNFIERMFEIKSFCR